jgi:hypothetical protein
MPLQPAWRVIASHPKYSRVVGAAILLASPPCFAHAPMPFDAMPLIWGALAIIFGLFVLIGRLKGAVAFFVMLGALWLLGAWDSYQVARRRSETRTFVAEQCFAAGQTRIAGRFAQPPRLIVVASDPELSPGSDRPALLHESLPNSSEEPGVIFLRTLPTTRDPQAGYVEIRMLRRPGSPAGIWSAEGLRVTVTDGTGRVMGERTDFVREFGWCLGERPFVGIGKFLRVVLGRPVGVEPEERQALAAPVVISPRGRAGPLEKGRFHKAQLTDTAAKSHRAYDLRMQVVSFRSEDAEWTVSKRASDSRYFDSMDLDERSLDGALLRRWHLRFPPTNVGEHGGAFEVRNAAVRGRVLTADVLFDRKVESTATKNGPKVLSEWFGIKIPVTAILVDESVRAGER